VRTAPYGTSEITELHVLTGAAHVGDLLFAVKSFLVHYKDMIALVIHGDPSVEADTAETIRYHFPEARLFRKEERDATVLPYLEDQGLARCRAFREANVFGERLVDTAVLSRGNIVVNMDTDCLAFRPLSEFRSLLEQSPTPAVHAHDPDREPFCISNSEAQARFGVKPTPHFNAGFCAIPTERLDLARVESWLEEDGYPMGSHFAEQTILAALSAIGPSRQLPEDTYDVGRFQNEEEATFIHYAAHYLSKTRIAMRRRGQLKVLDQLKNCR
jgi:hypothetical protein